MHERAWRLLAAAVLASAGVARAQPQPLTAPAPQRFSAMTIDSGPLPGGTPGEVLVSRQVTVPGAAWLRLSLAETSLAGDPAADGAFLRITSQLDGAQQTMRADALNQWALTSAYFNGDTVLVELVSRGNSGKSRLSIAGATFGIGVTSRSICGVADDRVLSSERANARLMPEGCTAWLFDDLNHGMLTAGHCYVVAGSVLEFNVPPSTASGVLVHPPPSDQYPAEPSSMQYQADGPGRDWCYFGAYPNSNTGLTAYQAQGEAYELAAEVPPLDGQRARVTGYGIVSTGSPLSLNQVQRTHIGEYGGVISGVLLHTADTTGGNSGSPVYLMDSRQVIGIHTHAGCSATTGANQGTPADHPPLRDALATPRGICGSAGGPVSGLLFAAGDLANNIGRLDSEQAAYGQLGQLPPRMQGLAYDLNHEQLYAVAEPAVLYRVDVVTGVYSLLGEVTGVSGTLNGLAYDPFGDVLFAIRQSDGQLFSVSPTSLAASPIGAARGGSVGGLDYDPGRRVLYGLSDEPGGTLLIRLDQQTGAWTPVGPLGAAFTDCNALAYSGVDGQLYTISATTGSLVRIDPQTGRGTDLGRTGGLFGSAYGMAARVSAPLCARLDYNRDGNSDQDDVADLLNAISSGRWTVDPDLNGDGQIDMIDLADLISGLAGGC